MSTESLEQRIAALESDVRALKMKGQAQLFSKDNPNPDWVQEIAGSMKDFPEFDEVRRFIREAREAELAEFDRKSDGHK
jgi:hypothetical protein